MPPSVPEALHLDRPARLGAIHVPSRAADACISAFALSIATLGTNWQGATTEA
jgi:hypothetical protein